MKKRITLTIEEEYIEHGKAFAKKEGKSVSQLVEDYFAAYTKPIEPLRKEDMSPITRELLGSLKGALKDDGIKNYREVYRHYLEDKYL